ncbi:phosphoribosyltransferase family protein [Luteimicrobium subarcticum]|uniref:Phosphoribosyl transferase-like protein n=1 Tax=Luteimicrobium subarcticum TaxID=620910 RepID=A0A2M8WW00_9MICO|nr:phosphoribosyltransferase family protein [Luteimicrobium subarcticum]PJI95102.1 phosphoribosyl transferase-like protein [Luteimicrobium subarcticum]
MTWRSSLAVARTDDGPDGLHLVPGGATAASLAPGVLTAARYSRFKHGDGSAAHDFGVALADLYVAEQGPSLHEDEVVVTGSGFDVAPPAAHALVTPFLGRLAAHGVRARSVVVLRTRPSDGDYASMGLRERRAALDPSALHVAPGDVVGGARVVALDDVRVTGVHERAIEAALHRAGARRVDHLFVVDAAGCAPQAEAALNAVAVGTLADLLALAGAPGHVPNARVARWVLGLPDADLDRFIMLAPSPLVRWIAEVACRDRFADLDRYRAGTSRLRELVDLLA